MKEYMKSLLFLMIVMTTTLLLGGCSEMTLINLPHYDQLTVNQDYNNNLFYRNDLETIVADPSVIYVDEGDEQGYFYLYGTTSELGASGVYSWKSSDLNHWQVMGPAFIPNRNAWSIRDIWAPEVIYKDGQYWMYYTGSNEYNNLQKGMSVAVSDYPNGPFKEYTGMDALGNTVDHTNQLLEFPWPAIDVSPFIDNNGDLYLYLAKDQIDGQSTIWGVKMLDSVTPDMSTLKQLTEVGKDRIDGDETRAWEKQTSGLNGWNEGPFVYEKDGTYYLTYSANPFWTREYAVGYATSSEPLGDFVKPEDNRILGVDPFWDHMSGTGHHSFVEVGKELFIVYHAHVDRVFGNSDRAVAIDRVDFREDGSLFANGPTYSLQPLPELISGYTNVACQAKVKTTNEATGTNNSYLTDGEIVFHEGQTNYEFKANKGKTTITLTFEQPVTARAIMIYNSYLYESAFKTINQIVFNNEYIINNLKFDENYISNYDPEYPTIRPGGAAIAEFDELQVNTIEITISSDTPIAISELVVLGKLD